MIVLHFIMGKANLNRANGVNYVIHGMSKYLVQKGHKVIVVGLSKNIKGDYEVIKRENFNVYVFKNFLKAKKFIATKINDVDIVHLHGVWNIYNIMLGLYLNKINKPYVVTIHSGLTLDRIKQSKYFYKILFHKFLQKKFFDNASGIHAITREEITEISKYTLNENIFFVPNGVDKDLYSLEEKKDFFFDKKIKFAYLGRFSKEKNIESLIKAFSLLSSKELENIKCFLIGPIDNYALKLKDLITKFNLNNVIEFVGPKYGKDKIKFLKSVDFYIHPALSDVVSIAVMESMACGLPSIITRTSQVSYYYPSNSFIMVEPFFVDIKRGIEEIISKPISELNEMSKNSLELIEDIFNWEKIVDLLIKEYKYIIKKHKR